MYVLYICMFLLQLLPKSLLANNFENMLKLCKLNFETCDFLQLQLKQSNFLFFFES